MDNSQKVDYLLNTFRLLQITLPQFILGLLSSQKYQNDPAVLGFVSQINSIIEIVHKYSETGKQNVRALANSIAMEMYVDEVERIAAEGSGLHFDATHANVQQLWEMLGAALLTREARRMGPAELDDRTSEDDDDIYYDTCRFCECMLGIFLQSAHTPQKVVETLARMGLSISLNPLDTRCLLLMHMIILMLTSKLWTSISIATRNLS